ncbi:family 10 glycosylhydrolase [Candidatus Sumerlaeota bacterium]|nr:family 10 glycosylhydrolase [Candidatus Sumerlaeota bacterium]
MINLRTMIKHFSCLVLIFFLFPLFFAYAQETGEKQKDPLEGIDQYINSIQSEFRGLWITRFEWPSKDPEECKRKIVQVFGDMEKANFNTAVFQVRGSADTLYPSKLEPWSHIFNGKDPGFDPLAFAISEARKRNIQFHAYINPIPLARGGRDAPPSDTTPTHLYYLHGPDSAEPWICVDQEGKPMDARGAGYWYFSPGIPQVHEHLRKVIRDLVTRYDIDGLHLDRIRYPGPQYSHDPISKERFYGRGNPNRKEWFDWQREQLSKFINDLYAEVMSIKPKTIISCSAWGIYNRYNIDGYSHFSSGYHDYYQDTWDWIRLGAMDLLVPMIYWNIPNPKPNYNELVDDFIKGVGKERLLGGQRCYGDAWEFEENVNEILYSRKAGIPGTVLFASGSVKQKGGFEKLKESLYKNKVSPPVLMWKELNMNGIILGTVTDEDGEPLQDAWVSLKPEFENPEIAKSRAFQQTWASGSDGRFAFLNIPSTLPVKLIVEYDGAEKTEIPQIFITGNEVKEVAVKVKGAKKARTEPFFHVYSPKDGGATTDKVAHILGRTHPGNTIKIKDQFVTVYTSGAFALDNIPLEMGENRIPIMITSKDHPTTVTRYLTIHRKEPDPPRAIDSITILEPQEDVALLPGDVLEIKVKGPSGCEAFATLWEKGKITLPLMEGDEIDSRGIYTAVYRIPSDTIREPSSLQVRLQKKNVRPKLDIKEESKATISVWNPARVIIGETKEDKTAITLGTHYVRLGGPYIAEVPIGTRFEISGMKGNRYKIKLSSSLNGWVEKENITILPENASAPRAFFTYCVIDGDDKLDKIWFPLKEKIVYSITAETEPENCLYIDFFNAFFATTWFSHKSGAKVVGTVTGEQIEDGRYRLKVPIKSKQIWGWWWERDEGGLSLYVKRPPAIAAPPESPFKNMTIAIESGHGGPNTGAIGTMGTKEKTINYNAVKAVRKIMEKKGARVVEVRIGDSNPSLPKRVQNAIDAHGDFYLSIHANAAGTDRGFLRVSGTSTYYKDKHCQLVAKLVYDELLKLDWGEFGVVGNFHYYPLRETRMPSMLVEQAFMSHPGDEARMLDPEYQKAQAEAIVTGMEKFLDAVRE